MGSVVQSVTRDVRALDTSLFLIVFLSLVLVCIHSSLSCFSQVATVLASLLVIIAFIYGVSVCTRLCAECSVGGSSSKCHHRQPHGIVLSSRFAEEDTEAERGPPSRSPSEKGAGSEARPAWNTQTPESCRAE